MTEPPPPKDEEEICPLCKRPKSQHSLEELLSCSKKLRVSREKRWWSRNRIKPEEIQLGFEK